MPDDVGDTDGGLIDLSGLSLRDLDKLGESRLLSELRQALGPNPDVTEAIAGFNNSV
jgi:FXSXX-COOH protein